MQNSRPVELADIWRAIQLWFTLPNTNMTAIRIMVALWGIIGGALAWKATNLARVTFQLSPLRFGSSLVELPVPPQSWDWPLFSIYYLACLFLISPFATPIFAAIASCIIGYLCLLDVGCAPHPITLSAVLLASLIFAGKSDNCTRRILQFEISLCYGFAVWHKIVFADYYQGYSLFAWMGDGRMLNPYLAPLVRNLHLSMTGWAIFSWFTALTECAFAVGVWFRRTRKWTVIAAALFHLGIFCVFPFHIMLYSCIMWTGLVAFTDRSKDWFQEEVEQRERVRDCLERKLDVPHPVRASLAAIFSLAMIVIPARFIFMPEREGERLSSWDRAPLSFAMFVQQDETVLADVKYQDAEGGWYRDVIRDRLGDLNADNHLYALANRLLRQKPNLKLVRVRIVYVANGRRLTTKLLTISRTPNATEQKLTVHSQPLVPVDLSNAINKGVKN